VDLAELFINQKGFNSMNENNVDSEKVKCLSISDYVRDYLKTAVVPDMKPLSNSGFRGCRQPLVSIDKIVFIIDLPYNNKNFMDKFWKEFKIYFHDSQTRYYPDGTMHYHYHCRLFDQFDIQWGFRDDLTNCHVRIEANPNTCDFTLLSRLFFALSILKLQAIRYTRIDYAVDYFQTLRSELFNDSGKRKYDVHGSDKHGVETLYLGGVQSAKFIRVYNKKLEFEVNHKKQDGIILGFDCFRIESVTRTQSGVLPADNPFLNLTYYDKIITPDAKGVLISEYVGKFGVSALKGICSRGEWREWKNKYFNSSYRINVAAVFEDQINSVYFKFVRDICSSMSNDIIDQSKLVNLFSCAWQCRKGWNTSKMYDDN